VARAQAVIDPLEEEIAHAGDAMMMLVSRSVWDTLRLQATSEGVEPGAVLSRALSEYITHHGSDEARTFLAKLAQEVRRAPR